MEQQFPHSSNPHKNNFLKLSDADIYYEVSGTGPAIIFIHGLGGNHLSWWQQVPYFSERYTCVNYSQRGFALSNNKSNRIGHSVFAEDLKALIDHLQLKNVFLVAQSMGGWTALTYTLENVENVRAVVMTSTSGTIDFRQTDHPAITELPSWEKWAQKEISNLKASGILNAVGFKMSAEQPALSLLYEQIYNLTPYGYKERIRTEIKKNRTKSPEILKSLNIPFLFVSGSKDMLFPPAGAEALTSIMPNAEFQLFEDIGHSVYFENPDEFNIAVDRFFSKIINTPV